MPKVKYCKNCKFYIPYNEEINDYDICGYTIQTYKDVVGTLKAKTDDNIRICDECGAVIEDNRKIKYNKCERKNEKNRCYDYRHKGIVNYFIELREWISARYDNLREIINRNIMFMFIAWTILNTLFIWKLIKYNYIIDYKLIIAYVIISLIYFKYAIVFHKDTKQ